MTTIRQIITDAYRESGILEVGVSPDADEHEEGLRQLRRLIRSLFGNELGEQLRSVNFGSSGFGNPYAVDEDRSDDIRSVYLPVNVRLIFNIGEAELLYLPPNPMDGARIGIIDAKSNFNSYSVILDGNGRKIEGTTSIILQDAGLNREWFYRSDLADWVLITDPDAEDENPFPAEFDDLLTTLLAFRINPRYGAETDTNLGETLREMRSRFRSRYRQEMEVPVEDGLVFLTAYPRMVKPDFDFNRG